MNIVAFKICLSEKASPSHVVARQLACRVMLVTAPWGALW